MGVHDPRNQYWLSEKVASAANSEDLAMDDQSQILQMRLTVVIVDIQPDTNIVVFSKDFIQDLVLI